MSNPVLAPDIWISVALSTHGCGSCWQMRHPVSRATQGSAAQRSRARGCSFLPSCLPCRWASDQRWNQSRTHAYPQPSSWFPCLHTEQIHQTQTVLILDLLIAVALSAHSHGNCWQMSHPMDFLALTEPGLPSHHQATHVCSWTRHKVKHEESTRPAMKCTVVLQDLRICMAWTEAAPQHLPATDPSMDVHTHTQTCSTDIISSP
ncbi:uncharacterized protein LOC100858183 isoform X1 [Gallus gallus]|uniref:uncharacterized protein LOC100858183 isoform X1 n=1 Tax=Gallus gallus TaxID=9031 RepID=UPI001AE804F6|nr:uncharacterized protein LOC100858183 isoform X1 [Gallus gallus]XP_040516394.1 uncharacterized protein LOC100858183 isoform X1 [Gallus gallus]XP_040516399.1 uncharacterized protein LOC100858183 isoform X1 [Gallus gallus]XP_040516402.1 uncharacterized protein LOC100858183 isoform X1 [Gallus gallus]XP_040516407.1 uncharacterized protein LOC100858183 isoform X1 [Gallus gallus]XP_040516415.1 uncharacterized protein LOC100858183 isoform X1 [Gallus gallus]XP_040516420.1 uncharacterized protein LO